MVAGITVYAYNTDAEGFYRQDKKIWPPRLHGWAITDTNGHFTLHTIRPGHYPGRQIPAHFISVCGAAVIPSSMRRSYASRTIP